MRKTILYRSLLVVPLVYIFILTMIARDVDVESNTNPGKDSDSENDVDEDKFEIVDRLVKETDIVFVRRRSLIDEMQREKFH